MSGQNVLTLSRAREAQEAKRNPYLVTVAAPVAKSEPLYEIRWRNGSSTGPFKSESAAAEHILDGGPSLPFDELFVDDDMRVFTVSADEDGLSKCVEGEIVEVRP